MDGVALLQASLILFAIVNPIGSIPIFLHLTNNLSVVQRRQAFDTATLVASAILTLFVLVGESLLTKFFRIGVVDLMAAGGLLLLIISVDHLVFGFLTRSVLLKEDEAHHVGAVPIACPILAGPGAMMTVLLTHSEHGFAVSIGSIIVVLFITWVIFRFIDLIYRVLGKVVCLVLSKILCLFLAAVGIHLLMIGLSTYFK